jgi:RNA polymerase sigma-70 factor (ECF subfamily)
MDGDIKAFEALFHAYHLRLLGFVFKLVKNAELAEDAMQEAWAAIYKSRRRLRDPDLFRSWVFSVSRNIAYQHLRDAAKTPAPEAIAQAGEALAAGTDTQDEERIELLYRALDRISPPHREVLVLKYLEGLVYDEIADVIGENRGTVRSRLHYAKKAMAEAMRRLQGETAAGSGGAMEAKA